MLLSFRRPSEKSTASAVSDTVQKYGRTFHGYKEGKYILPNDEKERKRLDLQHELARRMLNGKLHLAPVSNPGRVLDFGAGTGIWTVEFATENPKSDILGIDLSAVQRDDTPPNCRFELGDVEDEWHYPHKFNFIHGRYILLYITDIPKLMRSIYDNLAPGGYVEIVELLLGMQPLDPSTDRRHPILAWNDMMVAGMEKIGKDPCAGASVKKWMREAGFVNVTETKYSVASTPWWPKGEEAKIRGAMMMDNILNVAEGMTTRMFVEVYGWSREQVDAYLVDTTKAFQDPSFHAFTNGVCVWGQKPPA
ncbi:S-adenosyl-L-methionine-dependent methyltransferase [Apodospora peruviana]|uniref:S-adenosyl-L-methionine-dependent methyltransferase n=1 Tax=Apodospora peruviana TaxID=516989 RepID=A0AAE0M4U5_9PEZI|nr:S-adenosyl-L-methionine-dependent methyltransferase [Apodospora peruviana]